jgi:pyruvate kinase
MLKNGQTFTLTTKECIGDETKVYVNYKNLPKEIKKGGIIMLDDGKKKLEVTAIKGTDVVCTVLVGGETKGRRGVNLPGAYLKISSITEKDKKDIVFGLKENVDYMALSFVRTAEDIKELRSILHKAKSDIGIIAKIETSEALEHLDEIISLSDGVMVARGDLAIEIGPENVPSVQKEIIRKANEAGKPVVTATQMLESMIHSPVPTRAEVSDIANAIYDGTDAIMLSEETALGLFPIESVKMMTKVSLQIENEIGTHRRHKVHTGDLVDSVCSSVVHNAEDVKAEAIVALTESGFTARMIARYRPLQPIIAVSPNERVLAKMALNYGCYPYNLPAFKNMTQAIPVLSKKVITEEIAKKGSHIVVSAGLPFGTVGSTNMMLILEV